jgi:hypothetical protein
MQADVTITTGTLTVTEVHRHPMPPGSQIQQDLDRGFVTVQRRLAGEALSKYVLPFGAGYYYVLPAADHTAHGDYLARGLLEAES